LLSRPFQEMRQKIEGYYPHFTGPIQGWSVPDTGQLPTDTELPT
jgi:hypothetical protein